MISSVLAGFLGEDGAVGVDSAPGSPPSAVRGPHAAPTEPEDRYARFSPGFGTSAPDETAPLPDLSGALSRWRD